jgi:hypothetical protein
MGCRIRGCVPGPRVTVIQLRTKCGSIRADLASTGPEANPNVRRRWGPQQIAEIGLRSPVEVMDGKAVRTRAHTGVSDGSGRR